MKVCLAALIPLLVFLIVLPSDVSARRRIRQKLERKEDEYETSHIRKREMKFTEHFMSPNLEKTCDVCQKLYSIDKDNCVAAKKKAKLNCFRQAKGDRTNFLAKWQESGSEAAAPKESPGGSEGSSGGSPAASPVGSEGGSSGGSSGGSPAASPVGSEGASSGGSSGGSSDAGSNGGWVPVGDPKRNLKLGSEDEYFKPDQIKRTCKACSVGGVNYDECISGGNGQKYCRMTMNEMRMKFIEAWEKGGSRRKKVAK